MKTLSLLTVAMLSLVAMPALASHCPTDVAKIDEALAAGTSLSEAQLAEVKALRDEGEKLHQAGSHAESTDALHKALEMLGMPHDS